MKYISFILILSCLWGCSRNKNKSNEQKNTDAKFVARTITFKLRAIDHNDAPQAEVDVVAIDAKRYVTYTPKTDTNGMGEIYVNVKQPIDTGFIIINTRTTKSVGSAVLMYHVNQQGEVRAAVVNDVKTNHNLPGMEPLKVLRKLSSLQDTVMLKMKDRAKPKQGKMITVGK